MARLLLDAAASAMCVDSNSADLPATAVSRSPVTEPERGMVWLPDGRVVQSDNLSGAAITVQEVMQRAGDTREARTSELWRFTTTGREPTPGKSTATRRHERPEVLVERDPECPVCQRPLVMPVPVWRMTDSATATVDPQGRAVCARCRSKQADLEAAKETARAAAVLRARISPVPGPVLSFFQG
jgi:hypothetical protein